MPIHRRPMDGSCVVSTTCRDTCIKVRSGRRFGNTFMDYTTLATIFLPSSLPPFLPSSLPPFLPTICDQEQTVPFEYPGLQWCLSNWGFRVGHCPTLYERNCERSMTFPFPSHDREPTSFSLFFFAVPWKGSIAQKQKSYARGQHGVPGTGCQIQTFERCPDPAYAPLRPEGFKTLSDPCKQHNSPIAIFTLFLLFILFHSR